MFVLFDLTLIPLFSRLMTFAIPLEAECAHAAPSSPYNGDPYARLHAFTIRFAFRVLAECSDRNSPQKEDGAGKHVPDGRGVFRLAARLRSRIIGVLKLFDLE